MHDAHPGVDAGQATADVHEAGVVAGAQDLGARGHHVAHLVGEHRGGGLGVLHGEGAAEAAADLGIGQVDEGERLDGLEKTVGAVGDLGDPQRVAGGVVGDRVREVGAHVLGAQDIDEQLGEVVGVSGDLLDPLGQGRVAHVLGHEALLVAGGAGAGARGDDDGVPLAVEDGGEGVHVVARDLGGLLEVAGVGVHLAAADLSLREADLVAEALQDGDGCLRCLREHGVRKTGGEKGDSHDMPPRRRS